MNLSANKLKYLLHSVVNSLNSLQCPSCGSRNGKTIDKKYIFTKLIECSDCRLRYRFPLDSPDFNKKFYQSDYTEVDGITTELPDDTTLQNWMQNKFKGSGKEAYWHLKIMECLMPSLEGKKIVDFGASWGYKTFQFRMHGMLPQGFEISTARAEFGKKLDVDIKSSIEDLEPNNDIFYSSHVIEHLPNVPQLFLTARKLVSPDGFMITFCPNGSDEFFRRSPYLFHLAWGLAHPSYISPDYMKNMLKDAPYYMGSSLFNMENIQSWDQKSQIVDDVSGNELLVIAKINSKI